MDRAEARRRLEGSTEFVLVGGRLMVRDVGLLDLIASQVPETEALDLVAHGIAHRAQKPFPSRKRAA